MKMNNIKQKAKELPDITDLIQKHWVNHLLNIMNHSINEFNLNKNNPKYKDNDYSAYILTLDSYSYDFLMKTIDYIIDNYEYGNNVQVGFTTILKGRIHFKISILRNNTKEKKNVELTELEYYELFPWCKHAEL